MFITMDNIISTGLELIPLQTISLMGKTIRLITKYMAVDARVRTTECHGRAIMLISFEMPNDYEWTQRAGMENNLSRAVFAAIRFACNGIVVTDRNKRDISFITVSEIHNVYIRTQLPLYLSMLVQERLVGKQDLWGSKDVGSELFVGTLIAIANQNIRFSHANIYLSCIPTVTRISRRFIQAEFLNSAEREILRGTRERLQHSVVREQVEQLWNARFYERKDGLCLNFSNRMSFQHACVLCDEGSSDYHFLFGAIKNAALDLDTSLAAQERVYQVNHIIFSTRISITSGNVSTLTSILHFSSGPSRWIAAP